MSWRALAACLLVLPLAAACTDDSAQPAPSTTNAPAPTSAGSSPTKPSTSAANPTGPVAQACSLASGSEIGAPFGLDELQPAEQPVKKLGSSVKHSCVYSDGGAGIGVDVLYAPDKAGTEQQAITEATAKKRDVEEVAGLGDAAAFCQTELDDVYSLAAAKPLDGDSVMLIVTAKSADKARTRSALVTLAAELLDRVEQT